MNSALKFILSLLESRSLTKALNLQSGSNKRMRNKMVVMSERAEFFQGKRGRIDQKILSLVDADTGKPMLNTVDYVLSEAEIPKYSGKIQGKTVELAWNNIRANFGGRFRLEGEIVAVL